MKFSDEAILLHTYSITHYLVKLSITNLLRIPIVKWKNNRPADLLRCNEIATSCWNKRQPLDWLLYVSQQSDDTFAVLDGWHRYNTICLIHNSIVNPSPDLTAPSAFIGDASWFYNNHILVSVRQNMTYGEEIDLFQSINKSNPVAELYLRTESDEKKDFINGLVSKWQTRYKTHFKSSVNPRVPNTNRDRFADLLSAVYDKVGQHNVEKWLADTNAQIQSSHPIKVSVDALLECNKTGCYLFLYKQDHLLGLL
jgi:hypothetical protein